ncbi:MAG: OmpA family protein [Bacteroidia bacterium]
MKNIYIPIILLFGICVQVNAQEKSIDEKRGDKFSFNYSYDKAIRMYTHAKHLTLDGQRKLAVAYHQLDSNYKCEAAYTAFIYTPTGILPEDYYNYSMILKENGKYDQAAIWMDKFVMAKPDDLRAKDYAANKNEFSNWLDKKGLYKIDHMNTNTDAEDFGPSFYKDKIVFASSRTTSKFLEREDNWHRQPYMDLFVSDVDGGQLNNPKVFNRSMDAKYHVGPASFSKDGNFMAYTRNDYHAKSKDRKVELQIWFSNFKDGKWTNPEPFSYNQAEYSVGQPCLAADGNTMYFTSDMPGGYGKADLYKTTRTDGGIWSKPENLGNKVNTEGDELFPFYEEKSGTMFFASNGRYGLGGLDIFIYEMNTTGRVFNAGYPLNSTSDDFAIIMDNKMKKGYFCSNRAGGNGADDIYAVEFLQTKEIIKKIEGFAKNVNGKAVPNTFVTLSDDKDKILDTVTTAENGAYTFVVATDKKFKLNGKKESYLDGNNTASTFGDDTIVIADVTLVKRSAPIAEKIKVNADLAIVLELNNIYFDYDKSNIRPDAEIELNKIVKIMNEYPEMVVELTSFTDCRGTDAYNQVLSDKRAKSSVQYIKHRITRSSRISGKGNGKTKLSKACPCEDASVTFCSDVEYQKERDTKFLIVQKNNIVKE